MPQLLTPIRQRCQWFSERVRDGEGLLIPKHKTDNSSAAFRRFRSNVPFQRTESRNSSHTVAGCIQLSEPH